MEGILEKVMLFLFSIFAGTVRFINNDLNEFTTKNLIINASISLLSGILIYLLTNDIEFFLTHPSLQAGLIGLAGYTAPETLKLLSQQYIMRLSKR